MNLYLCGSEAVCFANDNDAFIPELWAMEGLMQLEEQMVVANLVHRDFEEEVARYGDTVNTRRPGEFKIRRKNDQTTSLDKQDAKATNVPVKLNQWFYNSFVIKDGEQSMSFQDLLQVYLVPSMRTIARSVDRALLGHVHRFLVNTVGRLSNLPAATSHEVVLEAREKLNSNNAPLDAARSLILSSMSETALLKNEMFIKANERGDGGAALEDARLGRILGFNTYLAQNVPYTNVLSADVVTGTTGAAYSAGEAGALTVSVAGYLAKAGEFVVVAGDDQATWNTVADAGPTDTDSITLNGPEVCRREWRGRHALQGRFGGRRAGGRLRPADSTEPFLGQGPPGRPVAGLRQRWQPPHLHDHRDRHGRRHQHQGDVGPPAGLGHQHQRRCLPRPGRFAEPGPAPRGDRPGNPPAGHPGGRDGGPERRGRLQRHRHASVDAVRHRRRWHRRELRYPGRHQGA